MSESGFDAINTTSMSDEERRIRKQVHRQADFYQHAITYVVVIAGLWILCLATINPNKTGSWSSYWAFWPTFGWGIGLLIHGLSAVPAWSRFGSEWEERKVREIMERGKR